MPIYCIFCGRTLNTASNNAVIVKTEYGKRMSHKTCIPAGKFDPNRVRFFKKIFGKDYTAIIRDFNQFRSENLTKRDVGRRLKNLYSQYSPTMIAMFSDFNYWKYPKGEIPEESIKMSARNPDIPSSRELMKDELEGASTYMDVAEEIHSMYPIEAKLVEQLAKDELRHFKVIDYLSEKGVIANPMTTAIMGDNKFFVCLKDMKKFERQRMMDNIAADIIDKIPVFGNVAYLRHCEGIMKGSGVPKMAFIYPSTGRRFMRPTPHSVFFFSNKIPLRHNEMQNISKVWEAHGDEYVESTLKMAYPKKAVISKTTELLLSHKDMKWEDLPTDVQTDFILWAGYKGYRTQKIGAENPMRKEYIPVIVSNNPLDIPVRLKYYTTKNGRYIRNDLQPVSKFDNRSFRVKKILTKGKKQVVKRLIVGCLKGKWNVKAGKCKTGTQIQAELYENTPENRLKARMKMTPQFKTIYNQMLKKGYSPLYALKKAWKVFEKEYSVKPLIENVKYRKYLTPLSSEELRRYKKFDNLFQRRENVIPLIAAGVRMAAGPIMKMIAKTGGKVAIKEAAKRAAKETAKEIATEAKKEAKKVVKEITKETVRETGEIAKEIPKQAILIEKEAVKEMQKKGLVEPTENVFFGPAGYLMEIGMIKGLQKVKEFEKKTGVPITQVHPVGMALSTAYDIQEAAEKAKHEIKNPLSDKMGRYCWASLTEKQRLDFVRTLSGVEDKTFQDFRTLSRMSWDRLPRHVKNEFCRKYPSGSPMFLISNQTSVTMDKGQEEALKAGETIATAAMTGATLGSVVPGLGTAVGAGVGALAGAGIEGVKHLQKMGTIPKENVIIARKMEEEPELKQYDLHVDSGLFWDEKKKKAKGKYFLMTSDDPSVGIFGSQISPAFDELSKLKAWWKKNKSWIVKELEKDDPDWDKLDYFLRTKKI